jgi:hypothetical protein
MPQNCTILLPSDEPDRVAGLVYDLAAGRGRIAVSGDAGAWSAITIRAPQASLTLNRRVFTQPGDEFSKMKLGMWAYFDRVETAHPEVKQEVLRRVEEFALAVGVVAEPEFVEDAGHFDCIFGLAGALGGVIWTGSGVLNQEGKMLFDGDGSSEAVE